MSRLSLYSLIPCGFILMLVFLPAYASGQMATVRGRVQLTSERQSRKIRTHGNVVVWLVPLSGTVPQADLLRDFKPNHPLRLVQRGKTFYPHLLVIPAGAMVEFPNHDPLFHNVFSLFEGKRFDLGLYEAGSTRKVHFDRAGVSYIFCNIHAQMSAVVIALKTPYYAISTRSGAFSMPVPPGRYELQVWNEGSMPEVLKGLRRVVTVPESGVSLAAIRIPENTSVVPHKNKYGHDYDPSTYDPLYQQQQN